MGVAFMVDNCSYTARLGSRKWAPRFVRRAAPVRGHLRGLGRRRLHRGHRGRWRPHRVQERQHGGPVAAARELPRPTPPAAVCFPLKESHAPLPFFYNENALLLTEKKKKKKKNIKLKKKKKKKKKKS